MVIAQMCMLLFILVTYMCVCIKLVWHGFGEYAKFESTGLQSCFLNSVPCQTGQLLTMLVVKVSRDMFTTHLGIGPKEKGREERKEGW